MASPAKYCQPLNVLAERASSVSNSRHNLRSGRRVGEGKLATKARCTKTFGLVLLKPSTTEFRHRGSRKSLIPTSQANFANAVDRSRHSPGFATPPHSRRAIRSDSGQRRAPADPRDFSERPLAANHVGSLRAIYLCGNNAHEVLKTGFFSDFDEGLYKGRIFLIVSYRGIKRRPHPIFSERLHR